jgi:DNA-binding response OmpR family regulator
MKKAPHKPCPFRIVMVDDDPDTLETFEALVSGWFSKAEIVTFVSSPAALQELEQRDPDLLITGEIMPQMRGHELVRRLTARNAKYPILVLTANRAAKRWVSEYASRGVNIRLYFKPNSDKEIDGLKRCIEAAIKTRHDMIEQPSETTPPIHRARPLKIVLVNDETGLLRSFELIIRHCFEDVAILMFDNGAAALAELSRTDPDLLLTDDTMLGMSGSELCERLLDKKVTYPIIVNSTWDETEQWVRGFANRGLNVSFLPLPCDVASLRNRMEAALNIRGDRIENPGEFTRKQPKPRPLRIVVMDDEQGVTECMTMLFEHWFPEATILAFTDAEKALQELIRTPPDLFTTDWNHVAPGCADMLSALRETGAKYPILVISAMSDSIIRQNLLHPFSSGGLNVSLLAKPLTMETLRLSLSKHFDFPKEARAKLPKSAPPEEDTEGDHDGATYSENEMRLMPFWFGSRQSVTYTETEIQRWLQLRAIEWSGWPAFITQPIIPLLLVSLPVLPVLLTLLAIGTVWPFVSRSCISLPLVKLSPLVLTFLKWPSTIGCAALLFMHHRAGVAVLALLWPLLAAFTSAPGNILTAILNRRAFERRLTSLGSTTAMPGGLPATIGVIERALAQLIGYPRISSLD